MDQFVYPINIPSIGGIGYFKEFPMVYYKSFVKTLLNGDDNITGQFIDGIISKLTYKGPDVSQLTAYDKFCIMLAIRAYNVSSTINFGCKVKGEKEKEKETTVNVIAEINEMLDAITDIGIQHFFQIENAAGMKIRGSLPKSLQASDLSWLMASCINEIEFNDKIIHLSQLEPAEQVHILDKLPSAVFTTVIDFLKTQNEILDNNPLFEINVKQEVLGSREIKISFFDTSMFELLKILYNTSLKEFYQGEYHLAKIKMPIELIHNSTPAEISLYYNIIADDMKKQQKEMEQSNQQSLGLPSPASGMPDTD